MILDTKQRLLYLINESWQILFLRIVSGKQKINKEASLQLQLARILNDLGNAYCILPNETFQLELETGFNGKNIDITCHLGEVKAAIELKCFMKSSNRAKNLDMYDALLDIERLESFDEFDIKFFFCLTNDKYYSNSYHKGKSNSVSLKEGTIYKANFEYLPAWAGEWKVKRDKSIIFKKDIICNWISSNGWYYLQIN